MQNIFISYRRDDASDATGRIADVLRSKFGENLVFKDVDSVPLGSDFRRCWPLRCVACNHRRRLASRDGRSWYST